MKAFDDNDVFLTENLRQVEEMKEPKVARKRNVYEKMVIGREDSYGDENWSTYCSTSYLRKCPPFQSTRKREESYLLMWTNKNISKKVNKWYEAVSVHVSKILFCFATVNFRFDIYPSADIVQHPISWKLFILIVILVLKLHSFYTSIHLHEILHIGKEII